MPFDLPTFDPAARTAKPKEARSRERETADKAHDKAWWALCRYVDARDGMRCRVCGRRVRATLALTVDRREHHHIIPRSLGGPDTRENVANVCKGCHDDRHVTRQLHVTGDAEHLLTCEREGRIWTSPCPTPEPRR